MGEASGGRNYQVEVVRMMSITNRFFQGSGCYVLLGDEGSC